MLNRLARYFHRNSPSTVNKSVEGQYREGPWWLPVSGGYLPSSVGSYLNWWQLGYDPVGGNLTAMVEACVSAYAQTIAMCPGSHWRVDPETGGREIITNSALTRILRKPNAYQTISDFLLNAVRMLYLDGNVYALALRNDRFEIAELHLMRSRGSFAQVSEDGSVFYHLDGNEVIDRLISERIVVPARDVLHIRLHTPRNVLRGESPILAAAHDVAASGAMTAQQVAFYTNMARPSNVLATDLILNQEQADEVRASWDKQSRDINIGGTPILTAGLKPVSMSTNAQDAQLAEMMKLSDQHVALVYRVPLQILGIGGTPYASTELLMQSWIASGLGFALNHIEEAFGILFKLQGQPNEYLELDTKALLRSSYKERIEALVAATKGVMAPNEARSELELPSVEFGDQVRVQQQDVPLSFWAQNPPKPPAPAEEPESDEPPDDIESPDDPLEDNVNDAAKNIRQRFRAAHARHGV